MDERQKKEQHGKKTEKKNKNKFCAGIVKTKKEY